MKDIGFGLWMAGAGMGMVFAILLLLTVALWLIGFFDARALRNAELAEATTPASLPASPAETAEQPQTPRVVTTPSGLTVDQLAAISAAVITHAQVRRNQAAPAMRTHQPGSLLHASRWVASGRSNQTTPWRRS